MSNNNYNRVSVLIVGAGPAGLAAAIKLRIERPDIDVCVIEKAAGLGNHNLSGAVLEAEPLHTLLDSAVPQWRGSEQAGDVLAGKADKDNVMFFLTRNFAFDILFTIKLARILRLGFGQMTHHGDYIVSVSKLTKWLGKIATDLGAEVLTGFAAEDIVSGQTNGTAAVRLIDQGRDKEGHKQHNFVEGEIINASFVLLAEGCDGLLTEKFVQKAGLVRRSPQLYSVGVKELIKVSTQQYESFSSGRVVHAMGYPIWTPVLGPGMFGGGIVYPGMQDHIAVGMIVGADWKYYNFNPQDALTNFKQHKFIKKFIAGGTVVEAGAKMIPEGGYYAIPREPATGAIGKENVLILGDSAGFVNMLKIKGLHNAIDSGIKAAQAVADTFEQPGKAAQEYTRLVEQSNIAREMKSARKFRQTVAMCGTTVGFGLSVLGPLLPKFNVEKDCQAMTTDSYRLKNNVQFDKDTFTAMAGTEHREEQPSHLKIQNEDICQAECAPKFGSACITFCPAGVYEIIGGRLKAANPSNCLHCKTCQRKCPYDNITWTVPEGGGGPRYKRM
ncbi:MAG TPA: electron-transfer flavoprotein:ubiquinone oxidoreductase [Sedimentisphaerales bacterium]|nr:electron-transfer flavoprotein:ubiquinone oxidoreductase [Sedimentisphaerales bacterium]